MAGLCQLRGSVDPLMLLHNTSLFAALLHRALGSPVVLGSFSLGYGIAVMGLV